MPLLSFSETRRFSMSSELLQNLAKPIEFVPNPLFRQGVTCPYHGVITLVLLGLVAGMPYIAPIRRWAKKHWPRNHYGSGLP